MLRPRGRFPSRDATPVPCRRASAPDRRERRLGVARDLGPSLPLADPGLPLAPQVEAVRPIGRNDSPRFRPGLASDPGCGACFASDPGSERPRAPSFPRFRSRLAPLQQRLRGRLVAACFVAGSSPAAQARRRTRRARRVHSAHPPPARGASPRAPAGLGSDSRGLGSDRRRQARPPSRLRPPPRQSRRKAAHERGRAAARGGPAAALTRRGSV